MVPNSKATRLVSLGVILAAAGAIYLLNHETPPSFEAHPHIATGAVMAELALGLLPSGGRLVVIKRDTKTFENPASVAQFTAFQQAVSHAGVTIAAVQEIHVDPLRPVAVAPGDFFDMLRKAPEGTVIVSFMGPPTLSDEQRAKLGPPRAKVVAFCAASSPAPAELRAIFDQQLLAAAVISRHDAPAPGTGPKSNQDWFQRSFLTITPANLNSLTATTP